ncbi:glycerol transport system permease protein [Nonomuraea thailandensis]|uniref:Glycerol transport system permease protein n=1 Tax=Nonomuraea thailandensis TaxID=1188745 RepID=A0A9X2K5X6_9ACTN|nr:sugar ABC transporter permease [Nonomuraea thailandensis]MCP2361538.1 glycerol transport system permease protein [Nonomuraea thailandensis]
MSVAGSQVSGELVTKETPAEEEQPRAPLKRRNNRAWWLVLPVVVSVAFTAVIPLMTVVNFSVQDVFSPVDRVFVGLEWFQTISRDPEVRAALVRTLLFSAQVLLLEIPLGVALAVVMPRRGVWVSVALVLVALPLLIPWNVVGTIWQIFARGDIGLGGWTVNNVLGINFNYTLDSTDAWITVLVMDVWHWTPLVALLAYAGLRSIPEPYFQAAQIDAASAWATFRHIQLPRLRGVLTIAILLRFMDSFMIYTEPFVVTGGGPGNATSFLSILLSKIAVGQFDVGPAAAFSLLYFLIVQVFCYVFFTVLTRSGR